MLSDLLISSQATLGIVIAALCVFAVAVVLYGVFRKFNQMGWLPWQIIVVALVMMLTGLIPETLKPDLRLWLICAIFLIVTGLVLGAGEVIRHYMLAKERPASTAVRVCNRVLGGITALLGFVIILLALAGLALPLCEYAIPPARDILSSFFGSAVYKAFSGYLLDFFLITLFVSVLNAGYRVGIGRGLLTLFMCLMTLVALALAVVLAVGVPALSGFAGSITEAIPGNAIVAAIVGYGVTILIWFVIFFTVFCLLGFLLNKLIRKIRYVRPVGIIGGIVMALIFFFLFLFLIFGINAFVSFMAEDGLTNLGEEIGASDLVATIQGYFRGVADAFTSSSFASSIYRGNPLRALF